MKADIHPTYHQKAKVSCACGSHFTVGSTVESIDVSICSACHPFYTGTEKIVDTQGRVDRFKKRLARKATAEGLARKATAGGLAKAQKKTK